MLEKIKDRLEKGKKIRASKKAAKKEKKDIQNTLQGLGNVSRHAYNAYVARLAISGGDYLHVSHSQLDHFIFDQYIVRTKDTFVLRTTHVFVSDNGEPKIDITYHYADKQLMMHGVMENGKIAAHVQCMGYPMDIETGERLTEGLVEEKIECVELDRITPCTPAEKAIIKKVDTIITEVEDICRKHEITATETESV